MSGAAKSLAVNVNLRSLAALVAPTPSETESFAVTLPTVSRVKEIDPTISSSVSAQRLYTQIRETVIFYSDCTTVNRSIFTIY